jgi:hypothetical protein
MIFSQLLTVAARVFEIAFVRNERRGGRGIGFLIRRVLPPVNRMVSTGLSRLVLSKPPGLLSPVSISLSLSILWSHLPRLSLVGSQHLIRA